MQTLDDKMPYVDVRNCVPGESGRFDGSHKRGRYVTEVLAQYVRLVRFCPEIALGLGVPRERIRLVASAHSPRAMTIRNAGRDVTDVRRAVARWA